MRLNKFIKLFLIIILCLRIQSIVLVNKSNATAESNRTTSGSPKTVNGAFEQCYEMRNPTSSLGNNKLDPHLATPRDMGIAIFLGLSSYGTVKNATGDTVTINSVNYTTTTGNATGVMDFGKNVTHTASYLEGSTSSDKRSNLYTSSYSRYVDVISGTNDANNNIGMAYGETSGWYSSPRDFVNSSNPVGIRAGVLGYYYHIGNAYGPNVGDGGSYGDVTYRPVLWN